jgi:excisionase family DNA binding protein
MAKPKLVPSQPCPICSGNDAKSSPPNMTIYDVAEYLGITDRCVRKKVANGELIAYKLGYRLLRFRKSDIDAALTPTREVRGAPGNVRDRGTPPPNRPTNDGSSVARKRVAVNKEHHR